jgi:adenylate cyclase
MFDGPLKFSSWFAELRRRKVIRVAVAYLLVAWVLIQIAETTFEPLGLPEWTIKLVIVLAIMGFPLACSLAWAFDVTPEGIERTPSVGKTGTNPATLRAQKGSRLSDTPAQPSAVASAPEAGVLSESSVNDGVPAQSVAILPFADMSAERDQEYFCDGIAEEIINALSCVRGLHIASRTSSFQFKGQSSDVREIGKALGVGSVLEGSVRKAGERVRIAAQLINAGDGYHLFSKTFDRKLEDVFAIQTEIAQELVRALQISLSSGEAELLERGGTRNAEAYDLYLRGQALLRDGTDSTLVQASQKFRAAIDRDPMFAQAHAGLANALAIRGLWQLDITPEEYQQAYAASERALELEPRMPEAILARACLLSVQQRNDEASESFEQALRLNPTAYFANYMFARHLFSVGETERSLGYYQTAIRLAPEEYQPKTLYAGALEKLGREEAAREAGRVALEAIQLHLQTNADDGRALQLGAVHAARQGLPELAKQLAERAIRARSDEFATLYNLACAFSVMGDTEKALDLLEQATRHGRGNLAWMEQDPDLDPLRGDPRFEKVMDRLRGAGGPAGA